MQIFRPCSVTLQPVDLTSVYRVSLKSDENWCRANNWTKRWRTIEKG